MKEMRYLVLFFVLCISMIGTSAYGDGGSVDDEFYRNKMIENMKSAGRWIISEGVSTFDDGGKGAIHRKLIDDFGVQIWVDPWIETDRYLAQFRIKARGINYDIHNLYREEVDEEFYEFWLIKVAARDWSGEHARSVFFVTRTSDIYGQREILVESEQFIESYLVAGQEIQLPLDDMELLYDMQAWLFPDNYQNSDLKNKRVVMDARGNITFVQ
ncbi:hypothetical protein CWE08_12125 [Aliidiomarina iranensis]|uniref:Uncharacterized protein n=1 Tax=Aliidiomarina iranensis TaxID=1434071 RepID=A0A432VPA8_9GAMM|nr:hypothetical protein [Aliidiomarina iranensis]RUO17975.1 hypothetical protein CWE08_12125 [Aliidiomarina iranensis]